MHWVAPGRCLIAWDAGQGPSFARTSGGAFLRRKAFASYDVYRTTDPMDPTGILIGTTRAEAFLDADAPEGGMVWYHVVAKSWDGGSYPVGGRIMATIPRYNFYAEDDRTPPSKPDDFKVQIRSTGNLLKWSPACDVESGLLCYFIYDSTQSQPDSVVWANDKVFFRAHAVRQFLDRTENHKKRYRLCALDCALNSSEAHLGGRGIEPGWTVYTYLDSSEDGFRLKTDRALEADVLLVGGGGGGGGGIEGGAGGGGGVVDKHGVTITAGTNDGEVIVGEGADELLPADSKAQGHGNIGEETRFGDPEWTAYGGGYGGCEGEWYAGDGTVTEGCYGPWSYDGGDGASGGGGEAWDNSGTWPVPEQGRPGAAVHNALSIQGHDGAPGYRSESGGFIFCGGGGGGADHAGGHQRFTYDQTRQLSGNDLKNGGHGVPCDIAGYGPLWEISGHTIRMIPWYGAGGEGCQRNMGPPAPRSVPGYGGGGAVGCPGDLNTGGGGGGNGRYGYGRLFPDASGPAGGRGIVVVRISTADEDLVTKPLITGTDPETGQPTCDDPHVRITRLDESQPHTDESGDEECPFD